MQGGLGPMHGQADWWLMYAPERNEPAIVRYVNESERLFRWVSGSQGESAHMQLGSGAARPGSRATARLARRTLC